jgi:acyl dehydratase
MFTAGIAAQVATRWFGVASVRTFSVRFHQKVFPEEMLVCTGEVTDVDDRGETNRVEADIVVVNEQDETVLTGSLTVDVGREAS